MIEEKRNKIENAKRTAGEKFARMAAREADFWREKEKQDQVQVAKGARLRALRLAKEAEDRETRAKEDALKRAAAEANRAARKPRKASPNP
jgi:hypothetical protein